MMIKKAKHLLLNLFCVPALAQAESITAMPFNFTVFTEQPNLEITSQLLLSCRHEKWVFGDTSEYEFKRETTKLEKEVSQGGGMRLIKFSSNQRRSLSVDGWLKPNKECMGQIIISFTDTKYSVGWAGQYHRPIKFKFRSRGYYREGDRFLDTSEINKQIEGKDFYIEYEPVPGAQVNLRLKANGESILMPTSAAINKNTNMPYLLRKD